MRKLKKEIRVLGIDDSPFDKFKDKTSLLIGTVCRGGTSIDGILSRKVKVDGDDSTAKIIDMVKKSKYKSQLKAILLDGINVAGFNVIDIQKLNTKTKVPVIVIMRKRPQFTKVKAALKKAKKEKSFTLMESAGKIQKVKNLYVQFAGCDKKYVEEILRITISSAQVPEAIRISHLIGAGIVLGESKGDV